MHINLGAREIYNYYETAADYDRAEDFCRHDTLESVEKYKKYYQAGGVNELSPGMIVDRFSSGLPMYRNLLMLAGTHGNVHLVKYIVENADPNMIEMRDEFGCTALHYVVYSVTAATEKVLECAHILIQAGANVNARSKFKDEYSWLDNHLPPPDVCLDEQNFVGRNLLGACVAWLTANTISPMLQKQMELLTELFIAHGATAAYVEGDDQPIGWVTVDEAVDESDASRKTAMVRVLHKARQSVNDKYWSKTRLLFLGVRDQGSPLSNLPADLQKLLSQKIVA